MPRAHGDSSRPRRGAGDGASGPSPTLALAHALQRSEILRSRLLLGLILSLVALDGVRRALGSSGLESVAMTVRLLFLGFVAGYALLLIQVVRRAEAGGRVLPGVFWVASAAIESAFPTLFIGVLMAHSALDPMTAVSAPAVVVYFLIGILSVLRLRPALSLLGGLLSAVQHAALVGAALATTPAEGAAAFAPVAFTYSALVALGGVCAAAVGLEIRRHVVAGLREADARAELADVRANLGVARDIQQSLLPREPLRLSGFECAGWNRPAEETGGDYYDWMALPDGRAAVAIADVTGHGVGPAMLMAVCRAYARATMPASAELHEAVGRLNRLVSGDLADGRFVTFAALILRGDSEEVDLLSAGHGPQLVLRRANGAVDSYGGDGLPLGVAPDEEFGPARRLTLRAGDVLLMATDGFFEATDAGGEQFGIERLRASLSRHAAAAVGDIPGLIAADVRAFCGDEAQRDDMTVVVIRRAG